MSVEVDSVRCAVNVDVEVEEMCLGCLTSNFFLELEICPELKNVRQVVPSAFCSLFVTRAGGLFGGGDITGGHGGIKGIKMPGIDNDTIFEPWNAPTPISTPQKGKSKICFVDANSRTCFVVLENGAFFGLGHGKFGQFGDGNGKDFQKWTLIKCSHIKRNPWALCRCLYKQRTTHKYRIDCYINTYK